MFLFLVLLRVVHMSYIPDTKQETVNQKQAYKVVHIFPKNMLVPIICGVN